MGRIDEGGGRREKRERGRKLRRWEATVILSDKTEYLRW
jgi:hypothetical protein